MVPSLEVPFLHRISEEFLVCRDSAPLGSSNCQEGKSSLEIKFLGWMFLEQKLYAVAFF